MTATCNTRQSCSTTAEPARSWPNPLAHRERLVLSPESGALAWPRRKSGWCRSSSRSSPMASKGSRHLRRQPVQPRAGREHPVGFAFHQNPQDPAAQRFPTGTYAYDLSDPTHRSRSGRSARTSSSGTSLTRSLRAAAGDSPPDLNPETPRPEPVLLAALRFGSRGAAPPRFPPAHTPRDSTPERDHPTLRRSFRRLQAGP